MAISEENVKEYEDERKKLIYDKVHEIISRQSIYAIEIEKMRKYLDTDVPNIGTTMHNKLNEISKIFQNAGLSMFAEPLEEYNCVISSFLGDAIINEMLNKIGNGLGFLDKYGHRIGEISRQKMQAIEEVLNAGYIKEKIIKIKEILHPGTISANTSFRQEELEELASYLSGYREVDKELWQYSLDNDLTPSIVNYIKEKGYSQTTIQALLEENIEPRLKKLGLEHLIPKIKQELVIKNERKSWELTRGQISKIEVKPRTEGIETKFKEKNSGNSELSK